MRISAVFIAMTFAALLSPPAAKADRLPDSYAELVARLLPAIVNISTFKAVDPAAVANGVTRKASLGSGFIIDAGGIIATNRHVVEGALEISVILHDNSILAAHLIGWGARTDIALLQVTPLRPLQVVVFGDSDRMRQGDQVLAIGNPLGLGGTVTTGIISARGRDIRTSRFDDYLQTDAAINPGNSGGPLFNLAGEVVGINTALFTTDGGGGSIGLGFAIPAFDTQFVIDRLRRFGRVHAGWVGMQAQPMSEALQLAAGVPHHDGDAPGVILTAVQPGGPAAAAGLQVGDVILKLGEAGVSGVRALDRSIGPAAIGSLVPVTLWRPGGPRVVPMTIGEDPEEAERSRIPTIAPPPVVNSPAEAGLTLRPVTSELRARYRLAADQRGLLVAGVLPRSVASGLGLLVGDVIVSVDRQEVGSVARLQQVWEAARRAGNSHVLLRIQGALGTRWIAAPA